MAKTKVDNPERANKENWVNNIRPSQVTTNVERTRHERTKEDGTVSPETKYKVHELHFRGKDGATYFADVSRSDVRYQHPKVKEGEEAPKDPPVIGYSLYVNPKREDFNVRRLATKEEQNEDGTYKADAIAALGDDVRISQSGKVAYMTMSRDDFMGQLREDVQQRFAYAKKMAESEKASKQVEGVEAAVAVEEKSAEAEAPEMV